MTHESQPGLGSGALREALTELTELKRRMDSESGPKLWSYGTIYAYVVNRIEALSLSSLPESAAPRNQDYKADLYADLLDFDQAVAYVRACALEGVLDIGLRDVLAANTARPDPLKAGSEVREADSEIRERLQAILDSHPYEYETTFMGYVRLQEQIATVCDVLAPSRKGAGGK